MREPATALPPVEAADVTSRTHRSPEGRPAVIWLGLDGLDWDLLDRLADQGKMPNWKQLTQEGYSARLESFFPLLSPILWTTAATGLPPDIHRVLDFQEVDPKTGRKIPISGHSRAAPAVWNIASAMGLKVGVVGWWATHPAEEVNGFFVSDHASPILFERSSFAGVVYPATLEGAVRETATREARIDPEELQSWLETSGSPLDERGTELARILGSTRVNHRLARELYDRQLPDLLVLYIEGTDEIGHVFGAFAPPKLACVSEADFARYSGIVEQYYRVVDAILGQWMRRAQEDGATLLVHSDHGFKWGEERPCEFASGNWATAAFWHQPQGVLAAWGARVRKGATRGQASLLDVAPTVLALLGLPLDPLMPGNPIEKAFVGLTSPVRRRRLEQMPVRRLEASEMTPKESSEYAKKLIALGYLSGPDTLPLAPPGGERPGMTEGGWNNLGVYLRDTRKEPRRAREAFEKSLALRNDYPSALFNLAVLERSGGRYDTAQELLFRSLGALRSDPAPAVTAWAREYEKTGRSEAARSLLDRASRQSPRNEEIARAYGHFLHRAKECERALAVLLPFQAQTREPRTLNALALFQACLGSRAEVIRLLERSLSLDPNQPEVARSLAVAKGGA